MNWTGLALRIPGIIGGVISTVEHFKGSGKDKETKVLEAIPTAIATTEFAIGKDLLNDAEIQAAAKDFIAAEVRLRNLISKKTWKPAA